MAFIELPEIGITGFLDGSLNVAGAPIVGSHGEVPIAELVVEELHVAGVGAGGFLGIEALVNVFIPSEAVVALGHELPHAAGAGTAIDGARLESGFGYSEVDQVLRDTFFSHDALNHGAVAAGALEGVEEGVVPLLGISEKVDEGGHVVVDHEREVGLGGGEVGASFGDEVWIDGESDIAGGFSGSDFFLGSETVTLLESFHLKGIDAVEEMIEFILELRVVFDVDAAGEHEVNGAIELRLCIDELTAAVGGFSSRVIEFNLCNDLANTFLRDAGSGWSGLHRGGGRGWKRGSRCLGRRSGGLFWAGRAARQKQNGEQS